ncbi:hypothetical protein [Helicobacter turcicus]|uniref:Uncharacterized protein n=1 Tax=Helicobacter turcicus TaxID=2867412 RepID=A0ABS7JPA6_9HELI|nr:hypothetical protein [Helicobacter turcicus]MBX7491236.1 hypothetical protein [Helicobacter turcicus]MBX7546125.1 hypothetical protein [Helicobacter turcicus]
MTLEISRTKHILECQTTYLDSKEIMLNKVKEILHSKLLGDGIIEVLLKTETYNEIKHLGKDEMYLWNPKNKSLAQKYPSLF